MSGSFPTAELSTADDPRRVYERPPQLAKPDGAGSLPRLLRGVPAAGDALDLDRHLDVHGELPHERRRRRSSAAELIEQVERAGLRGRGGAGFPTGAKLRAVAARRGRPIVDFPKASHHSLRSRIHETTRQTHQTLTLDVLAQSRFASTQDN